MEYRDERRTAVVIATGESVARVDLGRTVGWPRICVNDAYTLVPKADALYGADHRWWALHHEAVRKTFRGQLWTCEERAAREFGLQHIAFERGPGLSERPGVIRTGGVLGNSGAQALNLAYLWGARRLVLIGFDFQGGHFFGRHPPRWSSAPLTQLGREMHGMAIDFYRLGVEVLNCSDCSALRYWPITTIEAALPPLEGPASAAYGRADEAGA